MDRRSILAAALACMLLGAGPGGAGAQGDPKGVLRDALARSLQEPAMTEEVVFGPMKDGRTIRLDVTYRNDGDRIEIRRGSDPDSFDVVVPRQRFIRMPLMADAMLGCAREPRWCLESSSYLRRLERVESIERLPFFDDVYPESAPIFEGLRGSPVWAASVLGGLQAAALVITGHELGHAALGHLDTPVSDTDDLLRLEGEADGFLIALLQDADMSAVGGMAWMIVNVLDEERRGEQISSHPAPLCRTVAFSQTTLDWFARHDETIREEADRRDVPIQIPSARELSGFWSGLMGQIDADCDAYLADIAEGMRRARELFDDGTPLASVP